MRVKFDSYTKQGAEATLQYRVKYWLCFYKWVDVESKFLCKSPDEEVKCLHAKRKDNKRWKLVENQLKIKCNSYAGPLCYAGLVDKNYRITIGKPMFANGFTMNLEVKNKKLIGYSWKHVYERVVSTKHSHPSVAYNQIKKHYVEHLKKQEQLKQFDNQLN